MTDDPGGIVRWGPKLVEQLEWHWDHQLRRRLEGLTDDEYFWEPVPGWSVRPAGTSSGHRELILHGVEIALLRDLHPALA